MIQSLLTATIALLWLASSLPATNPAPIKQPATATLPSPVDTPSLPSHNTQTIILYDGTQGTLPGEQSFLYLALPSQGPTQVISQNSTILNTTLPPSDSAGYFGTTIPTLDRTQGYQIHLTLQLITETHTSAHRAGFSLISLSQDLQGIELGFWSDEIWAQHDDTTGTLFTHAEGIPFNTTPNLITYTLTITQDNYILQANSTTILTGPLRDYTNFSGTIDPYESPNLLFLGDNTSSAAAIIKLARIAITIPQDNIHNLYLPFIRHP